MPTISPERTSSRSMSIDFRPLRLRAFSALTARIGRAPAGTGARASSWAIGWSPIIIAAIAW